MRRCPLLLLVVLVCSAGVPLTGEARNTTPKMGPLRVSTQNPRYFVDGRGHAVLLTGSHVWWNLVGGPTWARCQYDIPAEFDYQGYLRWLKQQGHNFIRLWTIGLSQWQSCSRPQSLDLLPWARTGPGAALDGRPRFDLRKLNQRYFDRLRERVAAAQRLGIYVSVMLFEGWSPQFESGGWGWRGNPYNPANNVNGIDGDPDRNGESDEYTLLVPAATRAQEAYVRKAVDTVNGFDNVLYEIANEASAASTKWQYHMIGLVKAIERGKGKRHPVGMTFQHGDTANKALFEGPADWVSPFGADWVHDPPVSTGRKVVILDTDHLCGICGGSDFVWKSFTRGNNTIYMDPLDRQRERGEARGAMGRVRALAARTRLQKLRPTPSRCSTGFCLSDLDRELVVYQPSSGALTVKLRRSGRYRVDWLRPVAYAVVHRTAIRRAGEVSFRPPWNGPAILHLIRIR